jgi:hypothetical protein
LRKFFLAYRGSLSPICHLRFAEAFSNHHNRLKLKALLLSLDNTIIADAWHMACSELFKLAPPYWSKRKGIMNA